MSIRITHVASVIGLLHASMQAKSRELEVVDCKPSTISPESSSMAVESKVTSFDLQYNSETRCQSHPTAVVTNEKGLVTESSQAVFNFRTESKVSYI